MSNQEPKICSDCPRRSLLRLIHNESYTTTPAEDTTVKLCAKLRAYKDTRLPRCPHFPEGETLDNFIKKKRKKESKLDRLRREMHGIEDELNRMTNGEFFSGYAWKGLETFNVTEIKQLLWKYPAIKDLLRKAIALNVEFYEAYYGLRARALTDVENQDEAVHNILSLQRNFPEQFSLAAFARNH